MQDRPPPALLAGECQVWWASTSSARLSLLSYLDPGERTRWAGFHRRADRARYLTAHALARLVLASHLRVEPASILFTADPCHRCGEPHGKPRVIGDVGVEVSITHSGTMAGIAVALHIPIGIDVEDLRRVDRGSLADAVLSNSEHAVIGRFTGRERHRALLGYCTRKEALLKATGDGLTLPMRGLTVAGPMQPPRLLAWENRPNLAARMRLYDLHPAAGHIASLAAVGADLAVCEFWGDKLLRVAATTAGHSRAIP